MQFTINNKHLAVEMAKLGGVPGSKSTHPGAAAVMITADEFTGVTMKRITPDGSVTTQFQADVSAPGMVAVEFNALLKLSGKFSDTDITFTQKPKMITAVSGQDNATLAAWVGSDLPVDHPPLKDAKVFTYASKEFLSWISMTSKTMSTDETRPAICGVCIRSHKGVKTIIFGTDGRRMNVCDVGPYSGEVFCEMDDKGALTGRDAGVMISHDCVEVVTRALAEDKGNVRISVALNGILVEVAGTVMRLPRVAQAAPSIDMLIMDGQPDIAFSVNKDDFLKAVRRAAMSSYGKASRIGMLLTEKAVRVESDDRAGSTYHREIPSAPTIPGAGFSFNSAFMVQLITSATEDVLHFGYYRERHAMVVKETGRYMMLVLIADEVYPMP